MTTRLFARFYSAKFSTEFQPGPPKLPKEEQEEFERLQKVAASQIAIEEYNDSLRELNETRAPVLLAEGTQKQSSGVGSDVGSFTMLKIIPEFEGDVNPKTGERGGPKQDPLRHSNEWAFNGRVTDF